LPAVDQPLRPRCLAPGFPMGSRVMFWGGGAANGIQADNTIRWLQFG
jgi:hypothetical protein